MAEEKIFESNLSAVNEADYVRVLRNGKSSIISKDKLLGMANIEEREQSALQNLDSATASAMAEIESAAPELRQEVAQLSSQVGEMYGDIDGKNDDYASAWQANVGYYNVSGRVGTTIANADGVPTKSSSNSWRCYYISVEKDEEIVISGTGGINNTALYCFTDENFVIINKSQDGLTLNNEIITAPTKGYLLVNGDTTNNKKLLQSTEGIKQRFEAVEKSAVKKEDLSDIATNNTTEIEIKENCYYDIKKLGTILDTTPISSDSWCCTLQKVEKGDIFYVENAESGTSVSSVRALSWCDNNYKIIYTAEHSITLTGIVVAPEDGYVVVQGGKNLKVTKKSAAETLENNVKVNTNDIDKLKKITGINEPISEMSDYNLNEREVGADNMIWTWWYYPQAITLRKQFRPLMFGYTDYNRKTGVAKFCGDVVQKRPLKYFSDVKSDDHSSCAVLEMQDGRIMYVSDGNHGQTNYLHIRISKKIGNIDNMGEDIAILAADYGCSYAQVLYIGGMYYIFYRDGFTGGVSKWRCVRSADGESWSVPIDIITSTIQYYCLFRPVTDDANTIRMIMYSNPTMGDTNIRQGFINVSNGNIYNADNTSILGSLGSSVSKDLFTILVDAPSQGEQRLLDCAISPINNTKIALCRFINNSGAADYFVYDGELHKICVDDASFYTGSGYHGGVSFIGTSSVVVSRYNQATDTDEIEIYSLTNYAKSKTLNSYNTHNKVFREVRPIVDTNSLYVITHQGFYKNNTYNDFMMTAKIYEL